MNVCCIEWLGGANLGLMGEELYQVSDRFHLTAEWVLSNFVERISGARCDCLGRCRRYRQDGCRGGHPADQSVESEMDGPAPEDIAVTLRRLRGPPKDQRSGVLSRE